MIRAVECDHYDIVSFNCKQKYMEVIILFGIDDSHQIFLVPEGILVLTNGNFIPISGTVYTVCALIFISDLLYNL